MKDTNIPWAQPLNVNPISIEEWLHQLPRGESLTFWCLEKGKLSIAPYLMWAKQHYELPVVNSEYFQNEHPNRKLWQQIRTVANWSPALLPLIEWDGVVFVGCVEPPQDAQWSFPVRYLLVSHRDLKQRWDDYQIEEKSFNELPPPPAAPPVPAPQAPPPDTDMAPEGLSITLNFNQNTTSTSSTNKGFSFDDLAASLGTSNQETPSKAEASDPDSLNISLNGSEDHGSSPSLAPEGLKGLDGLDDSKLAPTMTHIQMEATSVPHATSTTSDEPAPEPTPPPAQQSRSGQTHIIDLDQAQISDWSQAKSEDDLAGLAFQQLQKHFQLSMILMVEGQNLKPWKWQKGFHLPEGPEKASVDINKASLFRIVHRTNLPYHGYVVESPPNMQFFSACGISPIPQHVTAQPLIIDQYMIGILVSIGDISSNTEESMIFSERVAHELINGFKKLTPKAA